MTIDFTKLAAEFPKEDISWRAQTLTKSGDKALALAYIDARDVMRRLDEVCGPAGWQDSYTETAKGRVVCTIRIQVGEEWIGKSDGAGDTAVEAEKGGMSDAFKRAAVKWGIGRYLYDLDAPWVPCESYETEYQGKKKKHWKAWKADPWSCVRGGHKSSAPKDEDSRMIYAELEKDIRGAATVDDLKDVWTGIDWTRLPAAWRGNLEAEKNARYRELSAPSSADPKSHLDRLPQGEAA